MHTLDSREEIPGKVLLAILYIFITLCLSPWCHCCYTPFNPTTQTYGTIHTYTLPWSRHHRLSGHPFQLRPRSWALHGAQVMIYIPSIEHTPAVPPIRPPPFRDLCLGFPGVGLAPFVKRRFLCKNNIVAEDEWSNVVAAKCT